MESRQLLAVAIDAIANVTFPVGKSLFVPITATSTNGLPLTYTATSSGAPVNATVLTGNTFLKVSVTHAGTPGNASDPAFSGDMIFELYNGLTPNAVTQITTLVNQDFYNNLIFHRVVPNFVIQGGDPAGNGTGGPGFQYSDEFYPQSLFTGNGQLALANSGSDTNGSQFFVTVGAQRPLDNNYTLFGQMLRGFDVLAKANAVPTVSSRPTVPVTITDASIIQNTTDAVLMLTSTAAQGVSTITVTAASPSGTSQIDSKTFTATTAPDTINDPPYLNPIGNQATTTNVPLVFNLSGTDLENDPLDYEALLTDATPHATVAVAGNVVTVTPNQGYTGPINLTVGVKQRGATARGSTTSTAFDTQKIVVNVANPVLTPYFVPIQAVAGTPITDATVGVFTSTSTAPASGYTATIAWGDGSSSAGTVVANPNGTGFLVRGSHTYASAGTPTIGATIVETASAVTLTASATGNVTAPVPQTTVTAVASPVSATAGTAFSGLVAGFTITNSGATAADFTANIVWGDGTNSAGVITPVQGGGFSVTGTHTYATAGSFAVTTTIAGAGSATANGQATVASATPSADLSVTINATPNPATVGGNVTYTIVVANNGTLAATGVTLTGSLPAGLTFVSSSITPSSTGNGTGPVTFSLGDLAAGASTTATVIARATTSGSITTTVSVASQQTDPTPSNNSATQVLTVSQASAGSGEGPRVIDVRRFGVRTEPTTLVLTFDTPLDLDRAEDVNNYIIVSPGRDGKLNTSDDFRIRVDTATYDSSALTVTLDLHSQLSLFHAARLRVKSGGAAGLTDEDGVALDGHLRGKTGGDFVGLLGARTYADLSDAHPFIVARQRLKSRIAEGLTFTQDGIDNAVTTPFIPTTPLTPILAAAVTDTAISELPSISTLKKKRS